ncbi:MAG: DUF4339 domain-containing protein [Spirochaetaceae bacterium]|nr:DUF4339 domain-containing protein [Spirochaetaceae bacterium]
MQNTKDNFFSMDRLVEFGMGMAMSQQIVQNMNNMMASMRQMPQMQVYAQPLYTQPVMQQSAPMQPVYRQYAGQPETVAQPQAGEQSLLPPPLPEVYYIVQGGAQKGPFSGTEIARLVMEKQVSASTPVWKSGMPEWKTAADFTELVALIALVPPAVVLAGTQDITKESES